MMDSALFYYLIIILIAIFILLISLLLYKAKIENSRRDVPINDERLRRITEKSATMSFYIGLITMSLLLILLIIAKEFFKIAEPGSLNILTIEILIMSISFLAINAYYSRYGLV